MFSSEKALFLLLQISAVVSIGQIRTLDLWFISQLVCPTALTTGQNNSAHHLKV
jgi:hypothetical protein